MVPITSGLGLIEWVGETKVLKEVMQATQEAVQVPERGPLTGSYSFMIRYRGSPVLMVVEAVHVSMRSLCICISAPASLWVCTSVSL